MLLCQERGKMILGAFRVYYKYERKHRSEILKGVGVGGLASDQN